MADNLLIELVLPIALASIMFGMGMTLTPGDFVRVVREPKAVVLALFGQLIALPLLAFLLASQLDLSAPMRIGLVLIAACPGGATSNLICHLARGNVALSISLTAVSSLVTLISIPLIVGIALQLFAATEGSIKMPIGRTILTLVGIVGIPVALGMLTRRYAPAFAGRSERPFSILNLTFMLALIIGIVASEWDTLPGALAEVGLAVILLNILAAGFGYSLGRIGQLPHGDVATLSIEVGIQNSTLAILLALTVLGDPVLAIPAGVYGLLMYGPAALLIWWSRAGATQSTHQV